MEGIENKATHEKFEYLVQFCLQKEAILISMFEDPLVNLETKQQKQKEMKKSKKNERFYV